MCMNVFANKNERYLCSIDPDPSHTISPAALLRVSTRKAPASLGQPLCSSHFQSNLMAFSPPPPSSPFALSPLSLFTFCLSILAGSLTPFKCDHVVHCITKLKPCRLAQMDSDKGFFPFFKEVRYLR